MYQIKDWDKRYEVSSKGREPKDGDDLRAGPLQYIRLKVYGHRQGTGFRRLQLEAKDKTMEVFGIFCKFLEIAGNQKRGLRGELLNEKDEPATVDDLAFILGIPSKQVSYAINILSSKDVGWLINTTQHNSTQLNSTQASGKSRKRPEISGEKEKLFTPPTLVKIKEYIQEKGYNVDPKVFLEYFTESGWVDSNGNKVRNWKQKIITWSSHEQSTKGQRADTGQKSRRTTKDRQDNYAEQESAYGTTIE